MPAPLRSLSLLVVLSLFITAAPAAADETSAPDTAESAPKPAVNGSIGAYGLVGAHFGEALTSAGGVGSWFDFGGGAEIGLASKSGRLAGRIRFAYYGARDEEAVVRHHGVMSAGLSVQLLKDVDKKFGVYALVDMGVSPLVTELRVFVFADVGVGVRYRVADHVELFGEVTAFLRYEKAMYVGPLGLFGARFRL